MADWSPEALATPDTTLLEEIFDLEDDGDKEVLKELYEQLLEDGPERMANMFEAMEGGDLEEVDRIAHRLKSSFGNLGFSNASELCNAIMATARDGDASQTRTLVESFGAGGEALIQGIAKFAQRL
ncbi:MAG: Hpt domain-containing protein [Planctomycetes bacterium]|nr:Hpt domain-containing protein [Planctomycetota bacterium]